jgi:hypothetical protein
MAVAIVFLMVIVAAVAVLFGCLRGFSRAAKQEKVHGLLVRVSGKQKEQTRLLEIPISATSRADTTSAVGHISKNTAGVVRLAIVLRSKSAGSAAAIPPPLVPESRRNTRPQNVRSREDRRRHRS